MNILISGSSGLVGSALSAHLSLKGHHLTNLVRHPQKKDSSDVLWDPMAESFDPDILAGYDAVIHLAGENIGSGLWTKKKKINIRDSRINSTTILSEAIAELNDNKPVFICASATGIYGDRGDEILTETSEPGKGFLADVVTEWEAACEPAIQTGAKVVNIRTGIVLRERGGILKRLLPIFKLGLGGKLGSGQQYMPWISLVDLVRIFDYCLNNNDIRGPLNAVALETVTNKQFTTILSGILSKPANIHIPAMILNSIFRDMARELFFNSARVESQYLFRMKFEFQHPTLKSALLFALNK